MKKKTFISSIGLCYSLLICFSVWAGVPAQTAEHSLQNTNESQHEFAAKHFQQAFYVKPASENRISNPRPTPLFSDDSNCWEKYGLQLKYTNSTPLPRVGFQLDGKYFFLIHLYPFHSFF